MSLATAASAYGLDPAGLQAVPSVYRPDAAYRAGGILLKPYRYKEQQLFYVTQALRHLERLGFDRAPRLIPARSGELYVKAGDRWYYAITWLDGRTPRFPQELGAAADALAAFHRASEGQFVPFSPHRSWRRRWLGLLTDLHTFRGRAEAGSTPFDKAYAYVAPHFIRLAESAWTALDSCGYDQLEGVARSQRRFCHRDCTTANLLTTAPGHVCLIDPDTWGAELRLHDLVRLLLSGCADDPGAALHAIAAYEGYGPLCPNERKLLPVAYSLPREYWWAGRCRYRRSEPGVDPERLLRSAVAGAPARDACAQELAKALR